ncbi:MAG: hypothetical protein ACREOU_12295 [Candidatus Eiseniibacteriota bacterium]
MARRTEGALLGLSLALALPLALGFAALGTLVSGCGGKFALPEETPGGVIPEKGSYAYRGTLDGVPNPTDVMLTLGIGRPTLYVVNDSAHVRAFPIYFNAFGPTNPLSYAFAGFLKPIKVCQGPNLIFVLDAGDTTLAQTDISKAPGFLMYGLTGGTILAQIRDTTLADVRGIAADAAGNVYVSCIAKEFIRDDPTDPRRRTYKFVSRVYRYRQDSGFEKDPNFFVDDGQGLGTVSEPQDLFVSPLAEAPSNLYIADTGKDIVQRMFIQDNGGEPLPAIALDGIQSGTAIVVPTDFVSDDVQFQYITDIGNRRVLRYNPEDLYIQKVNVELDRFDDSLHVPVAVTADDSLVYVADYQTGRVTWYQRRK